MAPPRRTRGAPRPRRQPSDARTVSRARSDPAARRRALVVVGALLLVALLGTVVVVTAGGGSPVPPADGSTAEVPAPTPPPSPPPSSPPPSAPPSATVEIPPLHPEIDDLPEATVTLTPTAGDGDPIEVAVKVAAAPADRARGLMEVTDLPPGVGMLFLFDGPRTGGFWMWNTVIPLDIAFADAEGVVHTILAMDPCEASDPNDCPRYTPDEPYVAALEVAQGWFEDNGLAPGAELTWTAPAP